jgi:hypothetical protein
MSASISFGVGERYLPPWVAQTQSRAARSRAAKYSAVGPQTQPPKPGFGFNGAVALIGHTTICMEVAVSFGMIRPKNRGFPHAIPAENPVRQMLIWGDKAGLPMRRKTSDDECRPFGSAFDDSTAFAASSAQHLTIIFLLDNHGSALAGIICTWTRHVAKIEQRPNKTERGMVGSMALWGRNFVRLI